MSTENTYISQSNDEEINLKELLYNYLLYWPWILASAFIFAVGGYFYVKSQVNIFESTAAVLVKDTKKGGVGGMDLDIFSDLGIGGGNSNLYNEIEVFNSRTLLREVVQRHSVSSKVRSSENGRRGQQRCACFTPMPPLQTSTFQPKKCMDELKVLREV